MRCSLMVFCAIIIKPNKSKFNIKCVFELLGDFLKAQKNKKIKGAQRVFTLDFFYNVRTVLLNMGGHYDTPPY